MTSSRLVPRSRSARGVPVIVHGRGEALNSSTPITGRSPRSISRSANASRSTSSSSALPIAAMIMPWSSER